MLPMPTDTTSFWTDAEPLECVMVIPEAPNVRTFAFRAPSGAWFKYKPGQFVTLELPTPGAPTFRTYTLSSSPSQSLSISVTAKAQPDSIGTRWMFDHLKPGMRLKVMGPGGLFTLPAQPDGKYLFISGGSGITPVMSMLAFLYDRGEQPDVSFIHCAQRPTDLIFRRRLEQMASRVPGIRLHFVVTEEEPFEVWTGYRGHFNQLMLSLMASDYLERETYCCGPEGFMRAVRDMLIALGYDMENYHQESFQSPVENEADVPEIEDVVPDEAEPAELVFASSGLTAECAQTDTILAVAKASGLVIPSGCTFGVCGTCKTRKLSGEVHMVHNGGISDEDIEAGYILACCSKPIGRVELAV